MHMLLKYRKPAGFTIVELLIVIVVIAILAGVGIASYAGIQARTIDKSVQSDADALSGIETRYSLAHGGLAKAWYSVNGTDSDLAFKPSPGNVIDVVISSTEYCIRAYNRDALTYNSIASAYKLGSTGTICNTLAASVAAGGTGAGSYVPPAAPTSGLNLAAATGSGQRSFLDVVTSTDATRVAAVAASGYIYTSSDSGVTWTARTSPGVQSWISITMSSDGSKLVAIAESSSQGVIYTSSDYGVTWTLRTIYASPLLKSIAASSNGLIVYAFSQYDDYEGSYGSDVWKSTDAGVTWNVMTTSFPSVFAPSQFTVSADGTKLAFAIAGGPLYTSINSGVSWVSRASTAGTRNWYNVSGDSTGSKLVASVLNGYIYVSSDSGSTWVENTANGQQGWRVAITPDGTKIYAATSGGIIFTSTNLGSSWTKYTPAVLKNWGVPALSTDGSKLYYNTYTSDYIYKGTYTP